MDAATLLAAVERALTLRATAHATNRDRAEFAKRFARLTAREREVLDGVVGGRLNKQIADDLGISEKTIKVHRARVMEKMEAASLADLVRLVVSHAPSGHWT